MKVNLFFDFSSIVALLAIAGALIVRKLTKGRSSSLFFGLNLVLLITAELDILTEAYGSYFAVSAYNYYLQYTLNLLYFILRNFTLLLYILYTCSVMGIWHKITKNRLVNLALNLPYTFELILLLTNSFHKKIFYFDENFIYQRGEWMWILYAIALYYFVWLIFFIIRYRNLVPRRTTILLFSILPVNVAAIVAQLFWPNLRFEIFASTLQMLILAVELQRPEEMMDMVVHSRNYSSFLDEISKASKGKRPISVLLIKFTNSGDIRNNLGLNLYSMLLRRIGDKLAQICKILGIYHEVYYIDHAAFAVVTEAERYEMLLDAGRIVLAYMQEPMKIRQMEVALEPKVCLVKYPEDIDNQASFINFATNFHKKIDDSNRVIVLTDIANTREFKVANGIDEIINNGIANNKFEMFYQPIYSVKEKRFTSAEALIRLFDEKYGMISPGLFIPAAEESGAIHQIGDFVLDDVCRFISASDFNILGLDYIEINLSVAQCVEANLSRKIIGILDKYHVDVKQINLEITETAVAYDTETSGRNIRELVEAGISLSLDDYGTGYSNIKRVTELPIDIVKLDKSLVDEMDNPMMWVAISNTVNMLQDMGMKILVEGVEEEREFNKFVELGCDYIQGYYFSRPLPEAEFLKFIKRSNGNV